MRKTISLFLILAFLLPSLIFAQDVKPTKVEGSNIEKLIVDTSGKCALMGYEHSSMITSSEGYILLLDFEIVPTTQEDIYLNLVPSFSSLSTVTVIQGPPKGVNISITNQYGSKNNAAVSQR